MRWSINLGSVAGTSVRIHLTFVLFLLWIGVSQYRAEGAAAAWDTLAFISLLFFASFCTNSAISSWRAGSASKPAM
jgi:uncharacterized membrane protein